MTTQLRRTGLVRASLTVAVLLVGSGCGLLDTNQPDIIDPVKLNTPEGARGKRIGAIADFAFANDGDGNFNTDSTDGIALSVGLLSDEFVYSGPNPTEQELDQRRIADNNATLLADYFYLHKARVSAEDAAQLLQTYVSTSGAEPDVAEMLSLAGFTYIYFAEDFCSGVPFSSLQNGQIVFGAGLSRDSTLRIAITRFDSALAQPGISPEIASLAQVGRGRALLDLAQAGPDYAAAAQAVQAVPTSFFYQSEHTTSIQRLQNGVWTLTTAQLWSVADVKGGVGLPFLAAGDPRVPADTTGGFGLDFLTPQFTQLKYPTGDTPTNVADGLEARLIGAEAQLHVPDFAGMTATLNTLRGQFQTGFDTLAVPGSQAAAEDLLFSERAFWLYATGHRLGDMRRLVRQYGRPVNQVFANGPYLKGGQYGTDVNLPIPIQENNNQLFQGCIDRNP